MRRDVETAPSFIFKENRGSEVLPAWEIDALFNCKELELKSRFVITYNVYSLYSAVKSQCNIEVCPAFQ